MTREFAKDATREQTLALLDCLPVRRLGDHHSRRTVEDNEIRRVAAEIRLDHADYIAVRAAHASQLASRK